MEEAVLLAERTIWQDDEGVRWVPEAAYQRMVSEVERLETPAPSPQQSGEAGIPPEAVQAEGGLLVSAGQWVIPNPFGCRVVDERMAYGWNQCRLAMIERKYPAPTQPAAGEELIEATEALMAWCVKNVNNWHFPQYDTAHRAIQNAKVAALTAAGKGA